MTGRFKTILPTQRKAFAGGLKKTQLDRIRVYIPPYIFNKPLLPGKNTW